MDLETGLICLGCVSVSVIVIYLTTFFSIREKTYDEAIAEARKSNQNLILTTKNFKNDNNKLNKKEKKRIKRSKEKEKLTIEQQNDQQQQTNNAIVDKETVAITGTGNSGENSARKPEKMKTDSIVPKAEHVGFKEPEIIELNEDDDGEESEHANVSTSRRSSVTGKPGKPILKNEHAAGTGTGNNKLVITNKLQRSNSFDVIKPKDELELAKIGKRKHKDNQQQNSVNEHVNGETKSTMITAAAATEAADKTTVDSIKEQLNGEQEHGDNNNIDNNNGTPVKLTNGNSSSPVIVNGNGESEIDGTGQSKKLPQSVPIVTAVVHKSKKSKSQNKGVNANDSQSKRIIKTIEESVLTNDELQLLINTLLNKQSSSDGHLPQSALGNGDNENHHNHQHHHHHHQQQQNHHSSLNSLQYNNSNSLATSIDTSSSTTSSQPSASEWMKKNDPMDSLRRQIREKDQQLNTEKLNFQAVIGRMKDLRHELDIEKNKQLTEKASHERQIQELHQRFQQQQLILQEQNRNEMKTLQTKLSHIQNKLTDERNVAIQRLQEESNRNQSVLEANRVHTEKINHLKHDNDQLRAELSTYEKHQLTLKQSNDDLHRKVNQLDEHIKSLMNAKQTEEFNYQQKLSELQSQLQMNEKKKLTLLEELNQQKSQIQSSENELSLMKKTGEEQLSELTKVNASNEETIKKLSADLKQLTEQLSKKEDELIELKAKLNELSDQSEKKSELNKLNDDLLKLRELHSNLLNENDTIKKELNDLNKVIAEKETRVQALEKERDDLMNKLNDRNSNRDDEFNRIEMKLKDEINERNALIAECGKLMNKQLHTSDEMLSSLSEMVGKRQELQTAFDEIQSKVNELNAKLSSFENESKQSSEEINVYKTKLADAESSAERMQSQVDKYKEVLSKTDNLLKTLEADAIKAENEWKEKLNEKEKQYEELLLKTQVQVDT